ncbi:outer membrane protein assembly factor BamB family protein [Methanolobus psychrotolerans]|uniref:outer membrane protein assembly factor BamB family protein n=1 Tax=Methanolobus psychrotolerans TaxID=1874706 RepID=UPI000B91CEAC|nr:PQQ-binding-like beta-propeller repeat protein [Methanolobus psychrotolerans]
MKLRKLCTLLVIMLFTFIMLTSAAQADKITAVRTITADSVEPGETFQVTVVITCGDEDMISGALDEDVPSGWVVEKVQNDGWSFNSNEISWLAGLDYIYSGETKTIIYNITVPADEGGGDYLISGLIAASGDVFPVVDYVYSVSGDTDVKVLGEPKFTSTDWPLFQKDLYNSGITTDRGPVQQPDDTESWATYTNGVAGAYGIDSEVLVVGDLAYAVTQGKVFALDRNTGDINWTSDIVEGVTAPLGTCAYGNGNLFVGAFGQLYSFDALTGEEIWNVSISTENPDLVQLNTALTYDGGRIYFGEWYAVGETSRKYYCYNEDGTERWSLPAEEGTGYYWAAAAIINNYVVYAGDDGNIRSVNKYEGYVVDEINYKEVFDIATGSRTDIRCGISFDPDTRRIYTLTEDGYCLSLKINENGKFDTSDVHKIKLASGTSTPAVYNGRVYVGTGKYGPGGNFYCLDASDLSEIWYYTPNGGVQASPAISTAYDDGDGEIYIYFTTNMQNGTVYCLRDFTGNTEPDVSWTYEPPEEKNEYTLHGVSIKDGRLFYGNDKGYVFGLAEWNYWDDPVSDGGEAITTDELQEAIHVWLNDEPAPVTGSLISTDRLQELIHNWLNT